MVEAAGSNSPQLVEAKPMIEDTPERTRILLLPEFCPFQCLTARRRGSTQPRGLLLKKIQIAVPKTMEMTCPLGSATD